MVAQVVKHAWCIWRGLGFKSCVCH